ncbi:hypothetical protein ROJ8625_02641 [Roseivivax jejudonensis]|uniref:Uncharacterized protein n=1 Tax=Roseivivax jejudonensis TaxID=1529041 RepID=A0A1X6ZKU7_9RHOB|nr:hypothetical protein [Roseivivax jejudonensis]SLN52400.1 hypothetical protein ROJ8625_02641 [Roseivivax jejudonensis]
MWQSVRDWALVWALVLTGIAAPVATLARTPVTRDAPLLVIARDPGALVARAGGRVVGPARAPLAILADADPGLPDRLRALGAWHVGGAAALAALCDPGQGTSK